MLQHRNIVENTGKSYRICNGMGKRFYQGAIIDCQMELRNVASTGQSHFNIPPFYPFLGITMYSHLIRFSVNLSVEVKHQSSQRKKSAFVQMVCILSLRSRLIWFLNYQNITMCTSPSRVRSKIFSYAFLAFFFIHVQILVRSPMDFIHSIWITAISDLPLTLCTAHKSHAI